MQYSAARTCVHTLTNDNHSGINSSQLSIIKTLRTYSFMLLCFFLFAPSNMSNGALFGINITARNSSWPWGKFVGVWRWGVSLLGLVRERYSGGQGYYNERSGVYYARKVAAYASKIMLAEWAELCWHNPSAHLLVIWSQGETHTKYKLNEWIKIIH